MAKPNYQFEKRQREQQKKQKKMEKAQRKESAASAGDAPIDPPVPVNTSPNQQAAPAPTPSGGDSPLHRHL